MSRQRTTFVAALMVALVVVCPQHFMAAWAQAAPSSGMQWQPTLEDAKRVAAQTNRLILVHFWSPSCVPCQQLEQNVFSQPQVQQQIQARFVPLKLNADDWPTTAKSFGVTRLPSDLVITSGGQIVGRMLSPPTADAYLQQLNIAASGTGPAASPMGAAYAANAPAAATVAQAAVASAPAIASTTSPDRYGMNAAPTSAAPVTQSAPQTANQPAVAAYSDSRYAEFYQRFGSPAAGAAPALGSGVAPNAAVAATMPPFQNYQSAPNPYSPDGRYAPQVSAPAAQAQAVAPANNQNIAQPNWSAQTAAPSLPVSSAVPVAAVPPLALDGYSPISLAEQQRWQVGDRRWGAIHRGRTYLFTSAEEQQKFLSNPDRYSPALSGNDPVVALDYGQQVEGKRQFGVEYQGRIYLFSSEASRRTFSEGPNAKRYAAEVLQAENPGRTLLR